MQTLIEHKTSPGIVIAAYFAGIATAFVAIGVIVGKRRRMRGYDKSEQADRIKEHLRGAWQAMRDMAKETAENVGDELEEELDEKDE